MTAITAITGTTDETPAVRLQPCAAFHFDPDGLAACGDCGGWRTSTRAVDNRRCVVTEPCCRAHVPRRLAS
jgi:hypothetical protein